MIQVLYTLTVAQLSGKRRVTLSEYKKVHLVNPLLYSMTSSTLTLT
jgi:hypothetical protein